LFFKFGNVNTHRLLGMCSCLGWIFSLSPPLTDPEPLIHLNDMTVHELFSLYSPSRKEVQS
jgi:hypothetical protein